MGAGKLVASDVVVICNKLGDATVETRSNKCESEVEISSCEAFCPHEAKAREHKIIRYFTANMLKTSNL